MMEQDRYGLSISGAAGIAASYDAAVDQLLRLHPDTGVTAEVLLAAYPDAPLAVALSAYLPLLGTDPRDVVSARDALTADVAGTEREQAHLAAAGAWVAGDMAGAGAILDRVLLEHPRDALALYVGHQIDFFSGDARRLRDRAALALSAYTSDDDAYGFALGMAAFGLEECGDYEQAMSYGLAAIECHPRDVWGIHAVVHCYEMGGDAVGGSAFLRHSEDQWAAGNGLAVHNHWHAALFDLAQARHEEVLARYDREMHREPSVAVPIELLDGTSLLWRLDLDGIDVGERWSAIAAAWTAVGDEPHYAFNDMHAAMAYLGADRVDDARRLVRHRVDWLRDGPDATITNLSMTAQVGIPVCEGLIAFAEERYGDACDGLLAVRPTLHRFGGSHAQRDVVDLTIIEAARRAGDTALVDELRSERRIRRG